MNWLIFWSAVSIFAGVGAFTWLYCELEASRKKLENEMGLGKQDEIQARNN